MLEVILRGLIIAVLFSYGITKLLLPELITKMRECNMVGRDVNKPFLRTIPNLGGIAALFGFSIALSLVVGVEKLLAYVYEPPFLAVISVFFIAAMIGLIDDISNISDKMKIIGLLFASIPLIITHHAVLVLDLPFGMVLDLTGHYWFFWLFIVPLGVTCAANALNMSAGYNGLESGLVIVVSFFLMMITIIKQESITAILIFAALFGCALALYQYNRYPARVFIGNIGTMGFGAAIASGVIIAGIELYGIICIIPAFYEAGATFYFKFVKPTNRRKLSQSPVIAENGKLSPPKGAENYTLAYRLLSKEAMTENELVNRILMLYIVCGGIALALSVM
jgi:UDP-N-acetylmuramyl pentapeptide phosphotransferase/UDP-N-acetylglucosamine-1-phosphate transferase